MLDLQKLETEVDNFISNITGEDNNFFSEEGKLVALETFWIDNGFEGDFEGYYKSNALDKVRRETIIVLYGYDGQYMKNYYIHKDNLIGIL